MNQLLSLQINIAKFSANMDGAVVRLLGIERGNSTTLSGPTDGTLADVSSVSYMPVTWNGFFIGSRQILS